MRERSGIFSGTWAPALLTGALLLALGLLPAAGARAQELDLNSPHAPDLPGEPAPSAAAASEPRAEAADKISRKTLRARLASLAREAPGASGIYVYDYEAGGKRTVFADGAGSRRKLASNTKLFTTATALDRFGAAGRLTTRVKQQGRLLPNGKLKGSLYLVGAGDPSLGSGGMSELAREIRRAGIKRVGGDLVVDDTVFDRKRGVPDSGFDPSPYIAPLSGLTYGGSTYSGDPAIAAGSAFRSFLTEAGVKLGGELKQRGLPGKLRTREAIAEYESPTMASLAQATNYPSNNFYAEMLLKAVAADTGKQGTTKRGSKQVEHFAKRVGSRVDSHDGSGLTDKNRASAKATAKLLAAMSKRATGNAFYQSLPRAGKEGTLASRMRGSVAEGRCRGKTGTISGVSALSGYCNAGRGDRLSYSILMNGVSNTTSARYLQDRMVIEIARYRP